VSLEPATPAEGTSGPALPVNRKAVYSVVVALVGVVVSVVVFPFAGFVLGVVAITSGVQAHREVTAPHPVDRGADLVVWGVALGGVAMTLAVLAWVVAAVL
jgi:hypothetical protein